ncbi:MAG: hypothetical protein E6K47_16950 [Gammaproteobacteria bacterium]|nr:MAG: hypothetical protein E6K47_16950 [Gammaproteobacteria bacterium]
MYVPNVALYQSELHPGGSGRNSTRRRRRRAPREDSERAVSFISRTAARVSEHSDGSVDGTYNQACA